MTESKCLQSEKIAQQLIQSANRDQYGLFWESIDIKSSLYDIKVDIYNGSSGIALYFLELYNHTQNSKYLEVAQDSINWIMNYLKCNILIDDGFFNGKAGICYLLIRAYELTSSKDYLLQASTLAESIQVTSTKAQEINFDLLAGQAGILLSLTHVFHFTRGRKILDKVNDIIDLFLDHIYIAKKRGIFWNRSTSHLDSLCGLSHGAAGIGWVLMELGVYFENEELKSLAYQTYYYETTHFNKKKKNWPDLRNGIYNQRELEEELLNIQSGSSEKRVKRFMSAWCHGAPGIGMSRLRMFTLTGDNQFLDDARFALTTTLKDTMKLTKNYGSNFSLCHGVGGNTYLPLQYLSLVDDATMNRQKLKRFINNFSRLSLQQRDRLKGKYNSGLKPSKLIDYSLLNGLSGIAYFQLFAETQNSQLNVLIPWLNKNSENVALKKFDIHKGLLKKHLPLSYKLIEFRNMSIDFNFNTKAFDLDFAITKAFKETFDLENDIALKEAFLVDNIVQKNSFHKNGESYLRLDQIINVRRLQHSIKDLPELNIRLSSNCKLITATFDWINFDQIYKSETDLVPDTYFMVSMLYPGGAKLIQVGLFAFKILKAFKKPNYVNHVFEDIKQLFEVDRDVYENLFYNQLEQLLNAQFLVIS